jgi:uroporphyrinogen-III synthase
MPRIVCIGPVTAEAAHNEGLPVSAVARVFTLDGMVGALSDMFRAGARENAADAHAIKNQ